MKKTLKFLIIILIIGASCFGLYYYHQKVQFDNMTYKGIDGKKFVYNKDQKLHCSINKTENIKNGDEIELSCKDQFLNLISFNKKIIVKDLLTDNLHFPSLEKKLTTIDRLAVIYKKIYGLNRVTVFWNKNTEDEPVKSPNDEFCFQTYNNIYQYGELGDLKFVYIKEPEKFDMNTEYLDISKSTLGIDYGKDSKKTIDSFLSQGWIRIDKTTNN